MIRVILETNQFEKGDRVIESVPFIAGGVARDYLPRGLGGQVTFELDGIAIDGGASVKDGDTITAKVRPGLEVVGAILFKTLVYAAISYAAQILLGQPEQPEGQGDEASQIYSWSGSRQTSQQGGPIAIHAGRMRIGGTIIGEYLDAQATPSRNVLYQLISLGAGPFKSIAGWPYDTPNGFPINFKNSQELGRYVFIGDERASSYGTVEAHVRMGSDEQDVIEWFDKVRVEDEIARPLSAAEDESTDNAPLYFDGGDFFDARNDALWNQYAVSHTMPREADSAVIRIRLSRGLYKTNLGTGELEPGFIGIQVRYRHLDAIGNPVSSGGPIGDGWVREPPVLPFPVEQRDAFEFSHEVRFFDKDTYSPPGVGDAVDFPNAGSGFEVPIAASPVSHGSAAPAFGVSTWVYIRSASITGADYEHILGTLNTVDDTGWAIGYRAASSSPFEPEFTVEWTSGSSRSTLSGRVDSASVFNQWNHIAFSYSGSELILWINGQQAAQVSNPDAMDWGSSIWGGRSPFAGAEGQTAWDGRLDDFLLWEGPITQDLVSEQMGTGQGRYGTQYEQFLRCWINWEVPGTNQRADNPWFGHASLTGGCFLSFGGGLLPADPELSGTPRRGRSQIEVARINRKSTAPSVSDVSEVSAIVTVLNESLAYGGDPLLALRVEADEQLSGSLGQTGVICETRSWPIWNGVSQSNPVAPKAYTANPAWVCLGIAIDKEEGLGKHFELSDIDLESVRVWADHCDEILPDGSLPISFTAASSLSDVRYHAFLQDPVTQVVRGGFEAILPKEVHSEPPPTWRPNSHIILSGMPTQADYPSTMFNDPNGTYEMFEIVDNGLSWSVFFWWDRVTKFGPVLDQQRFGQDIVGGILAVSFPNAKIQGAHPRSQFDGSFDTHGNAWEAMMAVAKVGGAMPVRSGRQLGFRFAGPKPAIALVGRGSIIEGSFEMTLGGQSQDNAFDYTFLDELRDYERTADEIFAEEITDTSDASQVQRKGTSVFGVTHPEQVKRQLKLELRIRSKLKRRGRFAMPLDGLSLEPGDVIRLDHDILPRGKSGRLVGLNTISSMTLDQDVTFEAGKAYGITLQRSGFGTQTGTVNVAALGGAGDYPQGTAIPVTGITEQPNKANPYILTEFGRELLVEVGTTTIQQDMTREIEFIEHDPTIFEGL